MVYLITDICVVLGVIIIANYELHHTLSVSAYEKGTSILNLKIHVHAAFFTGKLASFQDTLKIRHTSESTYTCYEEPNVSSGAAGNPCGKLNRWQGSKLTTRQSLMA